MALVATQEGQFARMAHACCLLNTGRLLSLSVLISRRTFRWPVVADASGGSEIEPELVAFLTSKDSLPGLSAARRLEDTTGQLVTIRGQLPVHLDADDDQIDAS